MGKITTNQWSVFGCGFAPQNRVRPEHGERGPASPPCQPGAFPLSPLHAIHAGTAPSSQGAAMTQPNRKICRKPVRHNLLCVHGLYLTPGIGGATARG